MPQPAAVVPEPAVEPVAEFRDRVLPPLSTEARHDRNDLILSDPRFTDELVITDAGIGFSRLCDPVEDVCAVIPAVKRKIILLQFFRCTRQDDAVTTLTEHRQHTAAHGRKSHLLTGLQPFLKERNQCLHSGINRLAHGLRDS